jgi:hypothetical protein
MNCIFLNEASYPPTKTKTSCHWAEGDVGCTYLKTAERPRSLMNEKKDEPHLQRLPLILVQGQQCLWPSRKVRNRKVEVEVAGWTSSFVHTNRPDDERIQQ